MTPSRSRSTSNNGGWLLAAAIAFMALAVPRAALGQACCAGGSVITPARLELHENWLVGAQIRAADVIGSFDPGGDYHRSQSGASELDFEQDLLGAARIFGRGQLALLVPFVETLRAVPGTSAAGGGLGDINASGRYDFVLAGQSLYLPGIAVLAGVTFPTGTPPESAKRPLATDATGIGALQGTIGLGLEQLYGNWFVGLTGLYAQRAARNVLGFREQLGAQLSALLAAAYTFDSGIAAGLGLSYTAEGNAVTDGKEDAGSGRRTVLLSLAALVPIDDDWRVQASIFGDPPASSFGRNQPASIGATATVLRAFR